jgi:hypothetical protein
MFRSCRGVFVKSSQGLFPILAFVVTLGVATDALACKAPGTHYCATTRTIKTWPGSVITGATQLGDYKAELKDAGGGFFNAEWKAFDLESSPPYVEFSPCEYDGKPALCSAAVVCNHFAAGTECINGKRTSKMMCPTTGPGFPGCHGTMIVRFPDGPDQTFTFDVDPNISTNGECNQQFPRIAGVLDRQEIGRIVQSCTGPDWSDQHPVLSAVVRNDRDDENPARTYMETSQAWFAESLCFANPDNGFPTGACTNDGGAWLTVGNNDPAVSPPTIIPELCAASAKDLTCGDQVVNGETVAGPAPKECKLDNNNNCTCRCARCNKAGTLVNLQGGTTGAMVLADPKGVSGVDKRPWAAICAVTVTGN